MTDAAQVGQPILQGPILMAGPENGDEEGKWLALHADPSLVWILGCLQGWEKASQMYRHMRQQVGDKINFMVIPVAYIHDIYGLSIEDAKRWRDDHYRTMTSLIELAEKHEKQQRQQTASTSPSPDR